MQIPNFLELPEQVERHDGNYLLFIGRLHPKKAIDNLLKALAITNEFRESNIVLKIAGRGTAHYEAELRRLVSKLGLDDKVEFIGQVAGRQKEELYAGARWTVMTSHTENFGMVVLESLAQNTPVIASRATPWEILEKERLGFWTDNTTEELSRTLSKAMTVNADEYEVYRTGGREFVAEGFNVEDNTARWIEVYRRIFNR